MDGVETFLSRLGLIEYLDMFKAKGFDCEDDIPYLLGDDLDTMYIETPEVREKILQAAVHYKPSMEFTLFNWLRSKGLEHYFVSFVQSELIDLVDIGHLNLPDEQLYDELEMTLPGHKRRFERAVHSLRKKQKGKLPSYVTSRHCLPTDNDVPPSSSSESELPVAYGRWGKPKCLADAKYDFLMLDATVISTKDPCDRVHIEFMVDSGSDVVTLRQEVLDTMDLQLIGPINSKGVHGSKVKNLYKAYILVGNQYVEIEVMGESYDSIGSRVMRHFRHYINGSHHLWLKGDFIDPTQEVKEKSLTFGKLIDKVESSQVSPDVDDCILNTNDVQSEHKNYSRNENNQSLVEKDSIPSVSISIPSQLDTKDCNMNSSSSYNAAENGKHNLGGQILEGNGDETDKLCCNDGEIVDVHPIITANRKRHGCNTVGLDPDDVIRKLAKKNRQSYHCGENFIQMNDDHLAGDVDYETLRVVLNQRTIYYHSQGEEMNISS